MSIQLKLCEHKFEDECKEHKGYSELEYDLYGRLGMTIVKNLEDDRFEIIKIRGRDIVFSGTFKNVIDEANRLEGSKNTVVGCDRECPKIKGKLYE